MKIQVVKKASKSVKPSGYCPTLIDDQDGGAPKQ
jgi:hypothetical protein